jgi:hypothetical protein
MKAHGEGTSENLKSESRGPGCGTKDADNK